VPAPKAWRQTARFRLAGLYGGLVFVAGAGLLVTMYFLIQGGLVQNFSVVLRTASVTDGASGSPSASTGGSPAIAGTVGEAQPSPGTSAVPTETISRSGTLTGALAQATLDEYVRVGLVALLCFAVVAALLAWWMSGRVLRPVHRITASARRLSADNLHERIDLGGPPGELKDLADTFDAMIARLDAALSAQQRFVANAAHELRTPLAAQRMAVDVGLGEEEIAPERIREIRRRMLEVIDGSEKLIEGLLLLAQSDHGLGRVEACRLDRSAERAVSLLAGEAAARAVAIDLDVGEATIQGNSVLLDHLVQNLVRNAVNYNLPDGWVRVSVSGDEAGPMLRVTNSGAVIDPAVAAELVEPFRRLNPRRHQPGEGAGLGLSIVASIAEAHGAELSVESRAEGGLDVSVRFA
jgi:signal transduction histidine kinase